MGQIHIGSAEYHFSIQQQLRPMVARILCRKEVKATQIYKYQIVSENYILLSL